MTTIPVQGTQIKYSDIQKAFGGYNSILFSTAAVANSLNTANNYTIAGLSLGSSGNISNVGTITATTLNNNSDLTLQTTTTNDIIFKTNSTEKMRILENGNVGIGATNPTYNLDVDGSINTNEYYIKGNNISNLFMSLKSIRVTNLRNPVNETTNPNVTSNIFDSNYYYYVFTNTGSNQTPYTITFNNPSICDILVVGGGGSGATAGGGGGAGQVIFNSNISVLPGTYNISIGKGGTSNNGYDSVFDTTIAKGGYMGKIGSTNGYGGNSGSNVTIGGSGTKYYSGGFVAWGGGGGAGGNGSNAYYVKNIYETPYIYKVFINYYCGDGGRGVNYSSYFSSNVGHSGWFASGGGGSGEKKVDTENTATGKIYYGGGGSAWIENPGNNGRANTGGGGGGGSTNYLGAKLNGGSGGSGVVIIRILKDLPNFKLDLI